MKFKVGDKVRVKKFKERPSYWNSGGRMDHLMGKVVEIKSISNGMCKIYDDVNRTNWILDESDIEAIKPETIVIYRKYNETIALDKRTGKKAVAKCSPEDTYNFDTGAKLAFERLTNNVTFRMLCVKDVYFMELALKKGKIYTYINGRCVIENGIISEKYNSYKDLIRYNPLYKNATVELKHGDNPEEILKKCEEKQPLNTKIIFTKGDDVFKTGHIYKIENGKLKYPGENDFLPYSKEYNGAFYSIDEVKDYFTARGKRKHEDGLSHNTLEFIEVVDD